MPGTRRTLGLWRHPTTGHPFLRLERPCAEPASGARVTTAQCEWCPDASGRLYPLHVSPPKDHQRWGRRRCRLAPMLEPALDSSAFEIEWFPPGGLCLSNGAVDFLHLPTCPGWFWHTQRAKSWSQARKLLWSRKILTFVWLGF